MPLYLSPVCNGQIFDANGDPLAGGQVETYLAGSSTPAATYTDDSGSTPQSNPIILNTLGFPTLGAIWLSGGVSYKFVIKNALGVTLRTIDDISGINDASVSQSEWVESGFVPTYISATSFSVPGDQTATLQIGRRLRTTNTSGFVFSAISNSVFSAGNTTVTVLNDSTTLDAGLSAVAYALLSATPLSAPIKFALNASGSAPIYAARAWVNFNGTGVVAIRASGNVSSVTDGGVGAYNINFATALPDANYSVVTSCIRTTNGTTVVIPNIAGSGLSTTSVGVSIDGSGSTVTTADPTIVSVAVFR